MRHSVEEIQLKNGARGILIDIPGASVMATRIQFRAGMMYSRKKDVYEIPHLVEHLAFGANAKFKDEQAFEAEFTKMGLIIMPGQAIFRFVTRQNALISSGKESWTYSESRSVSRDLMRKN